VSDRDDATGSADQDRGKENPAVPIMLYTAIVVGAMLTALLAGGIGMAGATSYKVGPYVGYALGLTMITIASVMGVGAGALLSQRAILKDNANIRGGPRATRGTGGRAQRGVERTSSPAHHRAVQQRDTRRPARRAPQRPHGLNPASDHRASRSWTANRSAAAALVHDEDPIEEFSPNAYRSGTSQVGACAVP